MAEDFLFLYDLSCVRGLFAFLFFLCDLHVLTVSESSRQVSVFTDF